MEQSCLICCGGTGGIHLRNPLRPAILQNTWNETVEPVRCGVFVESSVVLLYFFLLRAEAAKRDVSTRYTLDSIRESSLGHSEKGDYAVVKGTISFIK